MTARPRSATPSAATAGGKRPTTYGSQQSPAGAKSWPIHGPRARTRGASLDLNDKLEEEIKTAASTAVPSGGRLGSKAHGLKENRCPKNFPVMK
mmetsp:Transcript_9554/g.20756  ORF Transcript_9554/g.20756 Transcript_9554/m.20756 type:complete len:94 (+) Transcript_9554:408-689(+)